MTLSTAVRQSTVLSAARTVATSARTAVTTSRFGTLLTPLGRFRDGSTSEDSPNQKTPTYTSGEAKTGTPALTGARTVNVLQRPAAALSRAGRTSGLATLTQRGQQFVEGSFLYRWLTAEPEPDVIVIDLRETITVGPWLRAIQRAIDWLLPAAVSSAVGRSARSIHHALRTRPVRIGSLVGILLASLVVFISVLTGSGSPPVLAVAGILLVLSLVGLRSTRSWAELTETRAYQILASAFEPPELPAEGEPQHAEPGTNGDTDDTAAGSENS